MAKVKTKTGRLNQTEKYAIQGMLHQELAISEIAKKLQRTEKCIEKYVNEELGHLLNVVASSQTQQVMDDPRIAELDEALSKREATAPVKDDGYLKKTAGDKDGITISTQAATEQNDAFREEEEANKPEFTGRNRSKTIFRPKTGEYVEED